MRYFWHVTITGTKSKNVRHYKHITQLYKFIIRKGWMFKDQKLTLWLNNKPLVDIDYEVIQSRRYLGLKEGKERKEMIFLAGRGINSGK